MQFEDSTTLFLGDLSVFCTEKDIRKLFRSFGPIEAIRVKRGSSSKTNLSYGFIKFVERASAEEAHQQLNGIMFLGRALRIGWAEGKGGMRTLREDMIAPKKGDTAQIHVSFISKQVDLLISEATLRSLFGMYGEVMDVALKKSQFDKNLRVQNGYGFVHFEFNPPGIRAALTAVQCLHQVTIDRVTYDCSISHALQQYLACANDPTLVPYRTTHPVNEVSTSCTSGSPVPGNPVGQHVGSAPVEQSCIGPSGSNCDYGLQVLAPRPESRHMYPGSHSGQFSNGEVHEFFRAHGLQQHGLHDSPHSHAHRVNHGVTQLSLGFENRNSNLSLLNSEGRPPQASVSMLQSSSFGSGSCFLGPVGPISRSSTASNDSTQEGATTRASSFSLSVGSKHFPDEESSRASNFPGQGVQGVAHGPPMHNHDDLLNPVRPSAKSMPPFGEFNHPASFPPHPHSHLFGFEADEPDRWHMRYPEYGFSAMPKCQAFHGGYDASPRDPSRLYGKHNRGGAYSQNHSSVAPMLRQEPQAHVLSGGVAYGWSGFGDSIPQSLSADMGSETRKRLSTLGSFHNSASAHPSSHFDTCCFLGQY